MALTRSLTEYHNQTMFHMVQSHLGPTSTGGASYPEPSTLSPKESGRNYKITAWLNSKNFLGTIVRKPYAETDTGRAVSNAPEQSDLQKEWFRQAAMPWGNNFMPPPPNNEKRLNNPSQQSFVKQRQLNIGSTYGQFYAFMHALSAAFGTLSQGQ